jgi:VWFA-related protein
VKQLGTVCLAAAIAAAIAAALIAQAPEQQPQVPRFRTAVNLVRIDVYPTRDGRALADLAQDEFEILEDGVPQKIATFDRIAVRAGVPESARVEPRDLRESQQMAADPRTRLFVLFLDGRHTPGMWQGVDERAFRLALETFLQRTIGPDDMIALMTPETPIDTLSFVRRTASIEQLLETTWWQTGGRLGAGTGPDREFDDRERMYQWCYPHQGDQWVVEEMIARRREKMVFDALVALVDHLRDLREERKAILLVTGGWTLYTPNPALAKQLQDYAVPGQGRIGAGLNGRPTAADDRGRASIQDCERDRVGLAQLDDQKQFRELVGRANRANASFYPFTTEGLRGLETAGTRTRDNELLDLASSTDGIPVVNNGDYMRSVQRIVDDLASYYLIGYYSTNTKFDGRFRKVTVRVKRPGVSVRARSGYQALTEAEAAVLTSAAKPPDPNAVAVRAALGALEPSRPDRTVHLYGAWAWRGPSAHVSGAVMSLVVELDAAAARLPAWASTSTIRVSLVDSAGRTVGTGSVSVSPSARTALIQFADTMLQPGDYVARVVAQSSQETASDQLRVTIPSTAGVFGEALAFRRGPYTGPAFQPTADLRFRRTERLRVDVPLTGPPAEVAARLVDRNAQPIAVPVTVVAREESGVRIASAEMALAPLAPGDYVIEFASGPAQKQEKLLFAFRIVP